MEGLIVFLNVILLVGFLWIGWILTYPIAKKFGVFGKDKTK